MAKSIIEEVMGYRVKVEKDGKEILNVPGIFVLPGALFAPKASIVGTIAASLLGCGIHLESEDGKPVDVGAKVRKAADAVMDTAKTAARTVKEEVDKAWDAISADDPEGCPFGEENEEEKAEDVSAENPVENTVEEIVEELENHEKDDNPVIHVEKPGKPEDKSEE